MRLVAPETEERVLFSSEVYDVCIVGAGVAGSALAAFLGRNGKRVLVVEKDLSEQDRIVGELLQPDGVEKLKTMGLEFLLEGFDAQEIDGYAVFMDDRHIKVSYPEAGQAHFIGRGFRNGKFIQRMREYVQTLPSVTVLEASVEGLHEEGDKITGIHFKKGDVSMRANASLTVICDGFFSKLRHELSDAKAEVTGFFLGLVLKHADLPFPGHGHVFVTSQMPFLCYPISSDEVRALIDFPGKTPPRQGAELKKYLLEELIPRVPQQMQPAFEAAITEGKFKVMPNHRMPAKPKPRFGAVLLGDSLNMRHPLTGGGMTVALSDVHALGSLILKTRDLNDSHEIAHRMEEYYTDKRKPNASINILADALYGVFKSKDLSEACFDYLEMGGRFAQEPVAILSGISRNKLLLNIHFISVALYGAGRVLLPFPTFQRITRAYRMVGEAVYIISPLIENEPSNGAMKWALKAGKWVFPEKQFHPN